MAVTLEAAIVLTDAPESLPEVLGLATPLRLVLALGKVGVTRVTLVGEAAAAWQQRLLGDDRLAVTLDVAPAVPQGVGLCLDGTALFDVKALRGLVDGPDGAALFDGRFLASRCRAGVNPGDPLVHPERVSLPGVVQRVVTAADARQAEDALLESLRKPQDGVISRNLNRYISLAVTRRLARLGLRPNQVSVGILAMGLAGAWLASTGSHAALALGGLAFQAQSVLDGCDGELSRVAFRGSRLGEWIDTVGDDVTNYSFFAGAMLGLRAMGLGAVATPAGLVGLCAGVLCSAIEYRYLVAIGSGDLNRYPLGFGQDFDGPSDAEARGLKRLAGLLRPAFKRDFFVFATMLACFAGPRAVLVMLVLFAAGAVLTLSAVLRAEWSRGFKLPPS